ncbi:MAG: c-type cytochrome [Deltaproteobacteria bacterium]|nr:c-type cytochrome [Deltaproteobacteria bacterium]
MRTIIGKLSLAAAATLLLTLGSVGDSGAQQKKKELAMGPYFQTLKANDRIDASIKRGQKLFNELGCAGCHPRGGTIGGTAVDATGNRMNIQIPTLRGAALHYPRRAASGFMATIGTMNDL